MDENIIITSEREATDIKQNPKILLQLLLLEDINNVKQAIETYNIQKAKGFTTRNAIILIKARAKTLFFDVRSMVKRSVDEKHFNDLKEQVNHEKISEVLKGVDYMIDLLDEKRFLRIDSKVEDYTDTEAEAERKGL